MEASWSHSIGSKPRVFAVPRHAKVRPIGGTAIRKWLHQGERLAEIKPRRGRGGTGLRRGGLDGAEVAGISDEGRKAWGLWSDQRMPKNVYRDNDPIARKAAEEARDTRAEVRGE